MGKINQYKTWDDSKMSKINHYKKDVKYNFSVYKI